MQNHMTQEFVESFLEECFNNGISKEAAAAMLVRESVKQACLQDAAFAEGYASVADTIPGGLRPRFDESFLDKQATSPAWQHLKGVGRGLSDTFKNLGGLLFKDPTKATRSGISKLNKQLGKAKVIRKNPLALATAGVGLGGAGVYGASKLINRDNFDGGDDFLFMPPGGYTPGRANEFYDSLLNSHAKGIHEMNRKYHGSAERRKQLQEAVDNNLPGSAQAMAELQRLERERDVVGRERQQYLDRVNASGSRSAAKLKDIEERQRAMDDAKTSWLRAPQRLWLRLTGRDPNAYYDNRKLQYEQQASKHQTNARLRDDERFMIENGVINSTSKSKTPSEMQQTFFPTY